MKVLKSFEFTTSRARIPYNEAWFSGDIVKLTNDDLGPGDLKGKVQGLRNYAKTYYAKGLHAQVVDDGAALVIKAYEVKA